MKKNINILDELSLTKSMSSDRPGAVTQLPLDPRPAAAPLHSAVPHCIAWVSQEKKKKNHVQDIIKKANQGLPRIIRILKDVIRILKYIIRILLPLHMKEAGKVWSPQG